MNKMLQKCEAFFDQDRFIIKKSPAKQGKGTRTVGLQNFQLLIA